MKQPPHNIIVIVGPTASGKSDSAIALAKKYDGEIISADSRQVYCGMDIGTGKVTRDPSASHPELVEGSPRSDWDSSTRRLAQNDTYISEGIRHHLLDVASPKREHNISHFLRDAKKAMADIERRGKTVIICGGTHFWIQTLLMGQVLPQVKPNKILRAKLEKKSLEKLFAMLQEKDPERAETIDKKNKYRLIRALEIIESLGKVPALGSHPELVEGSPKSDWDSSIRRLTQNDNSLIIAINPEKQVLRERIQTRLEKRLREGMIGEVRQLRRDGISWKRLEGFGLEYRYIALFLQGKISEGEMRERLFFEIWHYAKRQLSFIRRMEKQSTPIHWITDPKEAIPLVSRHR